MSNSDQFLDKQKLLELIPFKTESYEHMALASLTAYCAYLLKKWGITTSYENIAVACHRMFPVKFAMVGWPQFPDMVRINRSILQMRPKYRNWAYAESDKGVLLNGAGIKEAESLIEKFGYPRIEGEENLNNYTEQELKAERGKRNRSVHNEDKIDKIRKSSLFKLFIENRFNEAEAIDLIELLDVYDHTPSEVKRKKINEFKAAAKELKDEKVIGFLKLAEEKFKRYLSKK